MYEAAVHVFELERTSTPSFAKFPLKQEGWIRMARSDDLDESEDILPQDDEKSNRL